MKLSHLSAALLVLSASHLAQDLNRLDLDNGGDIFWFINAPYAGAPVAEFDETGDLYWKVYPAEAIRRTSGVAPLAGLELVFADTDMFSSQVLWSYTINEGGATTSGTIVPLYPPAAFVPGLSTTGDILPPVCDPPGYITGWTYDETFTDTTGAPTALIDLVADGSTDWVFTHYFPAPGIAEQDPSSLVPNSCGGQGDVTFQWWGSADFGGGTNGENQADVLGTGNTAYNGFNIGGSGGLNPIALGVDESPDLSFLFAEPTLNPLVFTNDPGFSELDMGMAGFNYPLDGSSSQTVGVRIYDDAAAGSVRYGFAYANIRKSFLSAGLPGIPFMGTTLALNPTDPLFITSHVKWGQGEITADGDDYSFSSNQAQLQPLLLGFLGPGVPTAWVLSGSTIEIQGFSADPVAGSAEGTNVFTMSFH